MSTITANQVRTIQIARRKLDLDEDDFRTILRRLGGVSPDASGHVSSKDLTQRGFEKVMAHFEHMGFQFKRGNRSHFRERTFRHDIFADPRQVQLMHELTAELQQHKPKFNLEAFCLRMTRGRMDKPSKIRPREASNIIEALKEMIARESAGKDAPPAPGKDATGTDAGAGSIAPRPGVATVVHGSPSPTGVRVGQEWTSQRDPGADWFD